MKKIGAMLSSGFRRDCSGVATVEFAMVAVSMVVLVPIIWDLANVVASSMSLSGSMRAAVQYAMAQPNDNAGIARVIQTSSGFPSGSVTVNTTQSCECSGIVTTCGGSCPGGGQPVMYENIAASYQVPTLLPYQNYPTNSFTISRTVTVRIQ